MSITFVLRTWSSAESFCETIGMKLVAIETEEEEIGLEIAWTNVSIYYSFWTSGSDAAMEGTWIWTSTGQPLVYTNWQPSEPNNYEGIEDYFVKNFDGNMKWNDLPESWNCYSICEYIP